MSADGVGPFDNDYADDLCDDLRSLGPEEATETIRAALQDAVDVPDGDYLDRSLGEPAVAAVALVLASRAGDSEALAEADLEGVLPDLPDDILPLLVPALDRVLAPDSEIFRLWDEVRDGEEWLAVVNGLRERARAL
jgi:hypothetical protein